MAATHEDRNANLSPGVAIKAPCRAATTAAITLSGEQTIDAVVCVAGDRVLVKNQTNSIDNGIYGVSTGAWAREPDFDGNRDVVTGTFVFITSGATNAGAFYECTTSGTVVFGTSHITFAVGALGPIAIPISGSNVTFTQSGTPTAGSVSAKLQQIISVKDPPFGAVGDGVTDDTAAIQAALNAINTVGGTLYFPRGTYKVTTLSLTWGGFNVRLLGEAAGVSSGASQGTVITSATTGAIFTYNGAATPTSLEIDHIKFRTTNTTQQTFGLKISQSFNNAVRSCIFEGFSFQSGATVSAGLYLTGATNSVITHVSDCTFKGSYIGIYSDLAPGPNSLQISNCGFTSQTGFDIRLGDFSGSAAALVGLGVMGCTFESNVTGIQSTGGLVNALIDTCYFEWTGNMVPIIFDSNGASGINQSITVRNANFTGSLAAAEAFIHAINVDGLSVTQCSQLTNLASTQFLVKDTGSNSNSRVIVQAPSRISGGAGTSVATYYDGTTAYTDALYTDMLPAISTWTPADGSGAALAFTLNGTQYYSKIGKQVTAYFDLTYPATGNGNNALISGLPFAVRGAYGAGTLGLQASAQSLGIAATQSASTIAIFKLNTGGTPPTNANLTGARLIGSVTYLTV